MVSFAGDADTKICGAANIHCYNSAHDKLSEKKFIEGLADDIDAVKNGCNCLPSCTSISYDAEISQATFDWVHTLAGLDIPPVDGYVNSIKLN